MGSRSTGPRIDDGVGVGVVEGDGFGGGLELFFGDAGSEVFQEQFAEAVAPEGNLAGFGGLVGFDGLGQFGDAAGLVGYGLDDGDGGGFGVEFLGELGGAVAVRFIDGVDIGDFEDARFDGLDAIAHAGDQDDDSYSGQAGDVDFVLADSDGFDQDDVEAGGVAEEGEVGGGGGDSTQAATGGHGADEDAGVGVVLHHADAVAEDGAAGEGAGGIDGEDGDAFVACTPFSHEDAGEE